MSVRIALHHKTSYEYERAINLGPQLIRLRPAAHTRTRILSYSLKIEPEEHFINWQQDPSGNFVARIVVPERTRRFGFQVDLVAEMAIFNPFDFFIEPYAEEFPFTYDQKLQKELYPYMQKHERGPLQKAWEEGIDQTPRRTVDYLVQLNQRLAGDIQYLIRMEPGVQAPEETLKNKSGSCRDSTHLLVQILREQGLAARFVSGYLIQLRADEKPLDPGAPVGPIEDFTDLHAWAEVYVPGAGWIGLDPTSGLLAGEGHIPLAATPEPESAAPVSGALEPAQSTFEYAMTVQRLEEGHSHARPYSETVWENIDRLGTRVDEDLEKQGVRLTMGGEPTFVFSDDPDGFEWNFGALGKTKRRLAGQLLYRLHDRFGNGGVLYHGQGKWYPGEELPRWALGTFFRDDGRAIWKDQSLLARESVGGEPASGKKAEATPGHAKTEDAHRFLTSICKILHIDDAGISRAREDVYYRMWERGSMYADEALGEDERLKKIAAALAESEDVRGYVVPLARHPGEDRWLTSNWRFLRGDLFLIPGDSAMGYRLPLHRIPDEKVPGYDFAPQSDPLDTPAELPDVDELHQGLASTPAAPPPTDPVMLRTALCAEVRNGHLHIFLPPMNSLEDWLLLIAAVERAAGEVRQPVFLEGYEPPGDVRLQKLMVTPDPGVIEVNVHPSRSWQELKHTTEVLYEEARALKLIAEKFQIDGRPMGTGGGNHITLGGRTPAESPFLRRPDLLRSLITYWQHHPSLSYLFAGLFVGPTSQAPRIDEARHESLYELEIAFSKLPTAEEKNPWLVDRLLRNILVDITGNTHRAEFCIDKLYPPDNLKLRLGLVEFRAFEMPPHPQMYLAQMLLLRAITARFWNDSYHHRLVRWGTELNDRFMLPYFLIQDFYEILHDLRESGYDLDAELFEPFFEFRFPTYGSVQIGDTRLELRMGLEPWPVLGETNIGGSTSRPVDAAVERLQIRIEGLVPGRHVLLCNGVQIPLHATNVRGEFVAGVRFKAWSPVNTLHPAIQVHSPLIFDLVDLRSERSLGGCTYHVMHPGGRNYETRPVNAAEAEGRREARFERAGHSPGPLKNGVPALRVNAEYPMTLDLRRDAP